MDHVTERSDEETEDSGKLERPGDAAAFRLRLNRFPDEDAFCF